MVSDVGAASLRELDLEPRLDLPEEVLQLPLALQTVLAGVFAPDVLELRFPFPLPLELTAGALGLVWGQREEGAELAGDQTVGDLFRWEVAEFVRDLLLEFSRNKNNLDETFSVKEKNIH